jgi:hypothetical protein
MYPPPHMTHTEHRVEGTDACILLLMTHMEHRAEGTDAYKRTATMKTYADKGSTRTPSLHSHAHTHYTHTLGGTDRETNMQDSKDRASCNPRKTEFVCLFVCLWRRVCECESVRPCTPTDTQTAHRQHTDSTQTVHRQKWLYVGHSEGCTYVRTRMTVRTSSASYTLGPRAILTRHTYSTHSAHLLIPPKQ